MRINGHCMYTSRPDKDHQHRQARVRRMHQNGNTWVHLRLCLECGHVGCCDSAKNKHATKHFHKSKHPLIRSIEPGEEWVWCYVDQIEPGEMRPEGFVPIRG